MKATRILYFRDTSKDVGLDIHDAINTKQNIREVMKSAYPKNNFRKVNSFYVYQNNFKFNLR